MSFMRDSFSLVSILTALSLGVPKRASLPDSMNDSIQRLNVVGRMLCLRHSSAEVMRVIIDSMMIRTFSSGARCGFFIDKSTPEGVKFVTLGVFSFYGVHSITSYCTRDIDQMYMLSRGFANLHRSNMNYSNCDHIIDICGVLSQINCKSYSRM